MLHFGTMIAGAGHMSIWGSRLVEPTQDPEQEFFQSRADIPARDRFGSGAGGQFLGGIGEYRTDSGHPLWSFASGAYIFNTYYHAFLYASGQYSFALQIFVNLVEALNFHDSMPVNLIANQNLVEALNFNGTQPTTKKASPNMAEALALHDTELTKGVLRIDLLEQLLLADKIDTNAALLAYVLNIDTTALSSYMNYNFNSFAKLNNRFYGVGDDGIYELTGADDGGVQIDSTVKLGTQSLAIENIIVAEQLKRLYAVYLGVSHTDDMQLKITANGNSNFYSIPVQANSGTLHPARLNPGKGVASRYWTFELSNLRGADFMLESMTFLPIALTRRINEA